MQQRTLVRARDLTAFRAAVMRLSLEGTPLDAARRAVVVPTAAAGTLLRQTIEREALGLRSAVVMPQLVTRDGLMTRLHAAVPGAPPLLTRLECHVLMVQAASDAARRPSLGGPPFVVRPGLADAMLDLYDELGRRQRTVSRFARALFDQLRVERGTDRGSEGLIRQTAFLAFTFLAYERRVAASGRIDEHSLRRSLLAGQPSLPFDHLIVAVADHPADPRGLWPADYDLIGRLTRLSRLDIVMTDETHDAGLRARLEQELPGIVERPADVPPAPRPALLRPGRDDGREPPVSHVSRDREEELRDVARAVVARASDGRLDEAVAVVFHRPLPYLYLARQVLGAAGVPFQAFDALPLAAEPSAALLDLVLAVARTDGARGATLALLRSSLLAFDVDGVRVSLDDVSALEAVLVDRRASGNAETFVGEVEAWFGDRPSRRGVAKARAHRAAEAAAAIRDSLGPVVHAPAASSQVRRLMSFIVRHEVPHAEPDEDARRFSRARTAVLGVLEALASAFERHADRPLSQDELLAAIRHALESRTFMPEPHRNGVHLVDAMAARFGSFDHVHIVGLVETDWPERPRRSVFYASGLLTALSWPAETDQAAAQQAAFRDLLALASRTTSLHGFELDGDAVVAGSPLLEIARALPYTVARVERRPLFPDEILTRSLAPVGLDPGTASWLALRRNRPSLSDPSYSGEVGPQSPSVYRVSRVDRYIDCPFKYFAESVLGLAEERPELSGLTPLERGTLLHELFERFYRTWDARGMSTITTSTLTEARVLFEEIAWEALARLPGPDRALEATRLFGSIVARGVAERVFELEVDAGGDVRERLLETELNGVFQFPLLAGFKQKFVAVRGKADRIDVFDSGAIRVVDYKLGKQPDVKSSIQIGVYAHCASQALEARDGRPHPVASAMYLAFGDDRRLDGRLGRADQPPVQEIAAAAHRFAATTDDIESGRFPPRPLRPGECAYCGFAGVCRKEYRVEDDD